MYFSHLPTAHEQGLLSLFAPLTLLSSSCRDQNFMSEKNKKAPKEEQTGRIHPEQSSPSPRKSAIPGGERDAAVRAAPSPRRLRVALRAKARDTREHCQPLLGKGLAARHCRARLACILQAHLHLGERSGYRCTPFTWRCSLWQHRNRIPLASITA